MTALLTTKRIRDMYSWATAWNTQPEREDLVKMQDNSRAEFDAWLVDHDAELLERSAVEIPDDHPREYLFSRASKIRSGHWPVS